MWRVVSSVVLSVIMVIVIMLIAIMLYVVMLSVVAPVMGHDSFFLLIFTLSLVFNSKLASGAKINFDSCL